MKRRLDPASHGLAPQRGRFAALACGTIAITSWCVLNGLAAIGLIALLFIMLANASFAGFFREGGNLAAHYLAAAAPARAAFEDLVAWLFAGLFVLLALMRRPALAAALRSPAPLPPIPAPSPSKGQTS